MVQSLAPSNGASRAFGWLDGPDVPPPPVNYAVIAEAAGVPAQCIEKTADIPSAVKHAPATDGPALIDFVTDPRALSMPPHVTGDERG